MGRAVPEGRVASQEVAKGCKPVEWGSMYTMPQRLTVAGEATARSSTSNIMVMESVSWMISPLTRHSFLLSSNTCRQPCVSETQPCNNHAWWHQCKQTSPEIRLETRPKMKPEG